MKKIQLLIIFFASVFAILIIPQISWCSPMKHNTPANAKLILAGINYQQTKNYHKAFLLFKKTAPRDVTGYSHFALGGMYLNGWGTTENIYKALKMYKIALQRMHRSRNTALIPDTLNNMGLAYTHLPNCVGCHKSK